MTFVVAAVFVVLALIVVAAAVKVVPQGYEFTVERFGRYTRTLQPGIAILTPFVERVGRRMSLMEQVLAVPRQEVITKDNVTVQVDAIVFIQIVDAAAAAYRVATLEPAITQLVMTNLRTVVGSMELDEVLSQRDQHQHPPAHRDRRTPPAPWGVKVARIEIKDLQPPPDITNAMARQMKAERERRAVTTEADGEKQAQIDPRRGRQAVRHPAGRGPPRGRLPRRRGSRTRRPGGGRGHHRGVGRGGEGQRRGAELLHRPTLRGGLRAPGVGPNQKTLIVPADFGALAGAVSGVSELLRGGAARGEPPASPPSPPPRARSGDLGGARRGVVPPTEGGS